MWKSSPAEAGADRAAVMVPSMTFDGGGILNEEDGTFGAAVIALPAAATRERRVFLTLIARDAGSVTPVPMMGLVLGPGSAGGPRVDERWLDGRWLDERAEEVRETGGEAETA